METVPSRLRACLPVDTHDANIATGKQGTVAMARWWLAGMMFAWAAVAGAQTAGSGVMDYIRRAQYERVAISPDGASLAIAYRKGDGTVISVLRRSDMQAMAQIDPGDRGEVSALAWMGSHRLVIAANRSSGPYYSPIVNPAMYLVELGHSHPTVLPASFFGTLEGNDKDVLTLGCPDYSEEGECLPSLDRRDIGRLDRTVQTLAVAPIADADFLVDHAGIPRFAWAGATRGAVDSSCAPGTGIGSCSTTVTRHTWPWCRWLSPATTSPPS